MAEPLGGCLVVFEFPRAEVLPYRPHSGVYPGINPELARSGNSVIVNAVSVADNLDQVRSALLAMAGFGSLLGSAPRGGAEPWGNARRLFDSLVRARIGGSVRE